ncbi:MAG TPA: dienelactone hydrolase family protein, partial [Ilumatobacteraceae bacterium]|nr:dienelactone hydrolase family protein [Ilumatobacteraceae bacterium]
CMGGRVAFQAALEHGIGAAVSFYGGGIAAPHPVGWSALGGRAAELRAPVLAIFGDADHTIAVDDVEAWRPVLATAPVATDIVRYAEAGHGFHCDARGAYHAEAARDAWARTQAWLDRFVPATPA